MKVLTPGHKYELDNFEPNRPSNDVSKGLRKDAYELCLAIEACGASPQLTHAVTLASALGDKIGILENGNQALQFIEKIPTGEGSELKTINNGTTNEELLRVLIDRMNHLQSKFPCRENAVAITHFETGLLWLEKRTAERLARGVEGKQLK